MIPAIGLLVGIVLGLLLQPTVPVWLQPYLPIAVVAAKVRAQFQRADRLLESWCVLTVL